MYDEDDDEFHIYPVEETGLEKWFVWGCAFVAAATGIVVVFFD